MSIGIPGMSLMVLSPVAHSAEHSVNVFKELDYASLLVAREAVQQALETRPSHEPHYWSVRNVAEGVVIPRRTWRSASGHWCREFEENVQLINGSSHSSVSVRCRTTDGRWKLPGGD